MSFSVVIVAAGGGTRAGPGLAKQWRVLSGKPVLRWSVAALLAAGARDIVVVVSENGEALAPDGLAHGARRRDAGRIGPQRPCRAGRPARRAGAGA
jgi:2-C-methyl-D-erythritol 4-phosphate cytidylyltransferase/2-C-methyl-D-erythritol 2,4-cyclodiphosphate synthase